MRGFTAPGQGSLPQCARVIIEDQWKSATIYAHTHLAADVSVLVTAKLLFHNEKDQSDIKTRASRSFSHKEKEYIEKRGKRWCEDISRDFTYYKSKKESWECVIAHKDLFV